jgi:hypothetical protein
MYYYKLNKSPYLYNILYLDKSIWTTRISRPLFIGVLKVSSLLSPDDYIEYIHA